MSKKKNNPKEEEDIITLEFDDGESLEAELLGIFGAEGKEYAALRPLDGSDDILLYGYRALEEDDYELFDIEDDDEFDRAAAEYEAIVSGDLRE